MDRGLPLMLLVAVVEKAPMLVVGWGRIVVTPERLDDEDDHCDARDLVLAVACRPTQREVNPQAAIFVSEMVNNNA